METRELNNIRYASGLTMLAGAWLIISPLVFTVAGSQLWNQIIVGAILFVLGAIEMFAVRSGWLSWLSGIAALWIITSAFVLDLSPEVVWNEAITGIVALVAAYWDGSAVYRLKEDAIEI